MTDAVNVWTTEETLEQFTRRHSSTFPEDFCLKLSRGDVCLVVNDKGAQLHSGPSPNGDPIVTLSKMAAAPAKEEVRQLLFTMADSLSQMPDSAAFSVSPGKNHQSNHRATDFEPRQQNSAPSVTVKKRLPGASLINPGTKKKREATGVAFDDADDD